MTTVVHHKKTPCNVYIGRPSKWGNPFSHKSGTLAQYKVDTREQSVLEYEKWLYTQSELMQDLPELKDKILGCWCKPLLCHGDVLARLVNERYV